MTEEEYRREMQQLQASDSLKNRLRALPRQTDARPTWAEEDKILNDPLKQPLHLDPETGDALSENTPEPSSPGKKKPSKKMLLAQKIIALAACLVLIVGIWHWIGGVLSPEVGSAPAEVSPENSAETGELPGGNGEALDGVEGSEPLRLAPALPLTAPGAALEAQRELTMALSPLDASSAQPSRMELLDEYVIFAPSKAQTVQMVYPFISSFAALPDQMPAVQVDGVSVNGRLLPVTEAPAGDWQSWQNTLQAGALPEEALSEEVISLLAQPVTLYSLRGSAAGLEDQKDPAIGVTYRQNENTRVFGLAAHRARMLENGQLQFITGPDALQNSAQPLLMVLGEPLEDVVLSVYSSSACNPEDYLGPAEAELLTASDTLGNVLEQLTDLWFVGESAQRQTLAADDETATLLHRTAGELFVRRGLADVSQQGDPVLTDYLEALAYEPMVFRLSFDASLPDRGSTRISVSTGVSGIACADDPQQLCYEVAATLGSNLKFYKYSASLDCPAPLEITDNTFAFEPERNVFLSHPDPQMQHWSLRVGFSDSPAEQDGAPAGSPAE